MAKQFYKIRSGIGLRPDTSPSDGANGDIYYDSGTNKLTVMENGSFVSYATTTGAANTALSNLASVAVNTSLLPGTDNSIDVGSASKRWANVHCLSSVLYGATSGTITLQANATTTSYTVKWPNAQGGASTYLQNDGSGNLSWASITAGANTALSNLAAVAINTSLLPGTDNSIDLGSASKRWANVHMVSAVLYGSTSGTITLQANATTTSYTVKWPNAQGGASTYLQNDGSGNLSWASITAGANTALSNLAAVAINTSLLPGTDNSIDLGSASKRWANVHMVSAVLYGSTSGTITLQANATTTSYTVKWPNAQGGSSTVLQNDGSGNLSWATVSGFSGR